MQRLGYQSRCWTHPRLWNIRHNSSVQTVADGEKHVERPHVASSWAGIAIPSREEILRKPDAEQTVPTVNPTKQFRADLSYLNKRGSGLAGRLARKLDSSQLQEQAVAPILSIPIAPKQEVRRDPTIAQRRKERLEREARRAQTKGPNSISDIFPSTAFDQQERYPSGIANRNTSGPNTRKRPQQNGQNARRGDDWGGQQDNRGGMAPGASRRGGFAGRGTRGRGPRIVAIRRVRPDEEIGTERSNDITFQTVEEGGEDSEPAEYKLADLSTTNIDEIFASSPTQIASLTSPPPAASNLPAYRTPRWIQETLGGDYSRFADQSPADFVTPHQTLGPLKHVQLTLAHRMDIRINQRLQALKIIQSSVGVGTSDTAART